MPVKPIFNESDLEILQELDKHGKTNFSKLLKSVKGSPATITKGLQKLESKGIIKKVKNPESKREKIVTYCYNKLSIKDLIKLLS